MNDNHTPAAAQSAAAEPAIRLREVVAFYNNKGGVAKTTTVINLAAGLLRHDPTLRVLVIDLDQQCNASTQLRWNQKRDAYKKYRQEGGRECPFCMLTVTDALVNTEEGHLPIYKMREGLFLCPASRMLSGINFSNLNGQVNNRMILDHLMRQEVYYIDGLYPKCDPSMEYDERIQYIAEDFDYVLIDCPSAMNGCVWNAIGASTGVVVPMELSALSLDGLAPMIAAYRSMATEEYNPYLQFRGILITRVNETTNFSRDLQQYIRDTYGDILFKTAIHLSVKCDECKMIPTDIFDYEGPCRPNAVGSIAASLRRKSRAYQDYAAFTEEFLATAPTDAEPHTPNL